MKYLNFILTVLTIVLILHLLKPFKSIQAGDGITRVDIIRVSGISVDGSVPTK